MNCNPLLVLVILNKTVFCSFSISESLIFILNGLLRSTGDFKQNLLNLMPFLASQFRWKWSISLHKYEADYRAFISSSGLECFLYSWIMVGLHPMNFSSIFSESIEMLMWLFFFNSIGEKHCIYWLYMLNHAKRHMPLR